MKGNTIKEGDICSVFLHVDHGYVKSYRGDFILNYAYTFDQNRTLSHTGVTIALHGELFIPDLYNGTMTFTYPGTSRDALIDVAQKLGLGFFFCDDENTNDAQLWYCVADGQQQDGEDPPIVSYIKDVTLHAYKGFDAFYDSWIDPRYGLSFININKMLGEDGLDENVDLAFFNYNMTHIKEGMGNTIDPTAQDKKDKPKMQPKILSNIASDTTSMTSFYVMNYKFMFDNSQTSDIGLNVKGDFEIDNTGMDKENSRMEFNYSICTNPTKLKNGFYVLGGPGTNITYKQADNGDYIQKHSSVQGGAVTRMMSDADRDEIVSSGTNKTSSGNTHKFHLVAE